MVVRPPEGQAEKMEETVTGITVMSTVSLLQEHKRLKKVVVTNNNKPIENRLPEAEVAKAKSRKKLLKQEISARAQRGDKTAAAAAAKRSWIVVQEVV